MVCEYRRADPDLNVEDIAAYARHHHGKKVSETSVKRILKEAGLERRSGRPAGGKGDGEKGDREKLRGRDLVLGGMKLVEAAAVYTGYLSAMTDTVVKEVEGLRVPENALPPDTEDRDEKGRFLSSYNDRYKKSDTDEVAPGFVSVDLKRESKDPSLFHVRNASKATVERKLWALFCSPMIGKGHWDGMRTPRGELLAELCGYAYMPATLSLFTSELKYAGVADSLWETHARVWHGESQDWGAPRNAAILYVDGTSKPIWTEQHSQCTRVSLLGRTMPGLDIVGFHNGYGCPLWYMAHSGRAPLVKAVPKALERLEQVLGGGAL